MGAEISSLILTPLLLGTAAALAIYGEMKYSDEKLNKTLVGIAIALIFITILISFFMGVMI